MRLHNNNLETIKITSLFVIVFILWILFRDRLYLLFGGTLIEYSLPQKLLDAGFAFVTALSIYFLIQYYNGIMLEEANQCKNIIDNSNAVIFVKDPDGRYMLINRQFEQQFHITNKEIQGFTDKEIWSKEFADSYMEFDRKVLQSAQPTTFEEIAPHDDGLHTYISVKFPIRDLSGKIYALGGIATDVTELKKIELELEYALALSNATLESTTDGILVVTKDASKISGYNQKFVQMWNIPSELITSKVDKYVLDYVTMQLKEPQQFLSKVLELYETPEKESFDVLELANGRIFERYSKPQIARKEIIGRVWSFRDVTEKKQAEEKDKRRVVHMVRLQESILQLTRLETELSLSEKFDKIVKKTSEVMEVERVSIWIFDENQNSIKTDKFFDSRIHKYIPGTIFYRSDYPNYFKAIENFPIIDAHDAVYDSRTHEFAENYLKPLGITSKIDTPIRIGGKIIGIICLEHTGPKRIWSYEEQIFSSSIAALLAASLDDEAKRKSEEKYRFLAETVPQMFWTAQPDGRLDYFNSIVYSYTGKSFDELKDWNWENLLHPEDYSNTDKRWKESIKTGKPYDIEFRILSKNGEYRWHLTRSLPQKDLEGNILKWFGTTTDIHAQKSLVEELKNKNEDLSRTNSDLDNFVYTASHDLKAPISNIEGLLNSLIDSMPKECSIEKDPSLIIHMMEESIEKFKNVILDLTEISKAQKSVNEEIEMCSFSEIVDEIKISIAHLIESNNASILTNFETIPTIHFSKKNLRSILYNLISNAINYRSKLRDPIVKIQTEFIDEYILLTVKDNGLGIRSEKIPEIFRMFKRFHTHVEGSGVGLYIVKKIVENAEGKIEVESEVGVGTIFRIYLKQ